MKRAILTSFLLLVCVAKVYGLSCKDESYCEIDECCVANYASQIIGEGTCQKMGRTGSPCNDEELGSYGKYLLRCPCRGDLYCAPSGIYRSLKGTDYQIFLSQKCFR